MVDSMVWLLHFVWIAIVLCLFRLLYMFISNKASYPYRWACDKCAKTSTRTRFKSNREDVLNKLVDDHIQWHNEMRNND